MAAQEDDLTLLMPQLLVHRASRKATLLLGKKFSLKDPHQLQDLQVCRQTQQALPVRGNISGSVILTTALQRQPPLLKRWTQFQHCQPLHQLGRHPSFDRRPLQSGQRASRNEKSVPGPVTYSLAKADILRQKRKASVLQHHHF